MSTILRALRRLEQEKAADELVELHDSVVAPVAAPPPRRLRGLLLVAGAAVSAAAVGGIASWQLLGGTGELLGGGIQSAVALKAPASPAVSQEHAPSDRALESALAALTPDTAILVDAKDGSVRLAPVASAPPALAPVADPIELPPEVSSEVVVHRRPTAPAKQPPVASAPPIPVAASVSIPQSKPAAPAPKQTAALAPKPAAKPVARQPQPPPAPAALSRPTPPEPVEVAAAKPPPAPESWRELSAPQPEPAVGSSGIPQVTVTKTVWHPRPERRSAIVQVEGSPGSLDLKEGDVVGDLVLTQIKPSGVVFDYDGVELVRKIGARR